MTSYARHLVALLVAALLTVGTAGAAHAYPDNVVSIAVPGSVCSGAKVSVAVDGGGAEADFRVRFDGRTRSGSDGTTFTTSFTAPTVTKATTRRVAARATYADGSSLTATANVRVRVCNGVADDEEDTGLLPNTGGADLWWLLLAGGLVLAGGGVTRLRTRD